jgi:hypothetical protein
MTLDPEHQKRGSIDHACEGELHPEISAAYDYVDSVSHTKSYPETHSWSGWALREAFLAGITYAREHP